MVTIAVPQFVTLLLVRNFFSNNGIFNTMMANAGVTDFLHNIGLLDKGLSYIPFLTQPGWAMFTIIMINIWIGVPYQMLIATGVLMNIPADMIEVARIDGANPVQMFFRIKLPYLLSVQGPSLVTDFVKNVNNFNVIYLLTQGVFVTQNQALAQSNAKEIDLLVTWLFRLTQDYYNYKMAPCWALWCSLCVPCLRLYASTLSIRRRRRSLEYHCCILCRCAKAAQAGQSEKKASSPSSAIWCWRCWLLSGWYPSPGRC